jgi:putative protease
MSKPELLAPAGDRGKLEMALHYGADAVYLAGQKYGLRAFAGNFDEDGLREAVAMAHTAGAKAYVTVNVLPHEAELPALIAYLELLADIGPDALIIADLGVMGLARKYAPSLPLHVSTQFGVINSETA